jgi:hypothetical protein
MRPLSVTDHGTTEMTEAGTTETTETRGLREIHTAAMTRDRATGTNLLGELLHRPLPLDFTLSFKIWLENSISASPVCLAEAGLHAGHPGIPKHYGKAICGSCL